MADYVEDFSPGAGNRSPARAWVRSDAPVLSLDGEWEFRLHPSHHGLTEPPAEFGSTIQVPSHWVLGEQAADGHRGRPIYTNIVYPFPLDPPYVPDANPTADHRRTFTGPDWERDGARVLLRFDGVESVFKVWLNGTEVGVGKGSRLVTELDVTDALVEGENTLVVRVHQWSSMSYVEDQDQWWLPGIFRSVTLLGRPAGCLDDVWADADLEPDGTGRLSVRLRAEPSAYPVTASLPELGLSVTAGSAAEPLELTVPDVEPWSAEVPRRYELQVAAQGETVTLQTGFRRVRIVGDRFLVNNSAVTFRGVNRHEVHPLLGRAFDEDYAREDLHLMKRAGVNAIRTSHYPPHPRVLELADELGFWVVDECDLETHGFDSPTWRDNPSDDLRWREVYLDRIERTVERDKNHPCVVMWSLGNESGTGRNLAAMSAWVHGRDPGRPVHYEGDHQALYTDVYSRMYPTPVELESLGASTGVIQWTTPGEAARIRRMPVVMCEYVHAMGNGPGAMAEYDAIVERHPRLCGGFVWEWRDHGLLTTDADGTPFHAYGGDFGEVVHDGNFVMDGMLLPDGTETPSVAEFRAVQAPVTLRLTAGSDGPHLSVRSRYHTVDTSGLRFVATLTAAPDGHHPGAGPVPVPVPVLAPGAAARVELPAELLADAPAGLYWLRVRAETTEDLPWAPAGHLVAHVERRYGTAPAVPSPRPSGPRTTAGRTGRLRLGAAEFDAATGRLVSLGERAVDGPRLELFRAPTDNDRLSAFNSYENEAPEASAAGHGSGEPSSAERWRDKGLDRLMHRLVSLESSADELVARVRVGAAASKLTVDVVYHWQSGPAGLTCFVDVVPSLGWDGTWPRVGVRFDLPLALRRADWFGTGPGESYPDTCAGVWTGAFTADVDDLGVRYSRPQETGHRGGLHRLALEGDGLPPFRLSTLPGPDGHRPGFTVSRWTPQQVDLAPHPHQLPAPTATHLFLDDLVHGVGSRACGIDVLPQHALTPHTRRFGFLLEC